jgi:hypothetical protein
MEKVRNQVTLCNISLSEPYINSIMTWGGRFKVRIPLGTRYFPLLKNVQTSSKGPPQLLFNGYWGTFLRVKWLEHEVNCSPQSSAEIKHEWSYTPTLLICLHGVYRDNSTFLLLPHAPQISPIMIIILSKISMTQY